MKTAKLTGTALDWAVGKCEKCEESLVFDDDRLCFVTEDGQDFEPSSNWAQGGLIIEREMIEIGAHEPGEVEWVARDYWRENQMTGWAPLIAAMRCYVSANLGADVEVPEGLI